MRPDVRNRFQTLFWQMWPHGSAKSDLFSLPMKIFSIPSDVALQWHTVTYYELLWLAKLQPAMNFTDLLRKSMACCEGLCTYINSRNPHKKKWTKTNCYELLRTTKHCYQLLWPIMSYLEQLHPGRSLAVLLWYKINSTAFAMKCYDLLWTTLNCYELKALLGAMACCEGLGTTTKLY